MTHDNHNKEINVHVKDTDVHVRVEKHPGMGEGHHHRIGEPEPKPDNSLRGRMRRVKKTRWIRFAIVSIIFFAWVILMGNPWLALLWLLLADITISLHAKSPEGSAGRSLPPAEAR